MHVEAAEYNEMWHITEFLLDAVPESRDRGGTRSSAARVTGVLYSEGGGRTEEARRKQEGRAPNP
jgi:hypothetical protein